MQKKKTGANKKRNENINKVVGRKIYLVTVFPCFLSTSVTVTKISILQRVTLFFLFILLNFYPNNIFPVKYLQYFIVVCVHIVISRKKRYFGKDTFIG